MRFAKLLISSFLLIASSGCKSFQVSDWAGCVELPYSKNGYCKNVLSRNTNEIPAAEWARMPKISILSKDYKILRRDYLDNCQYDQCKQIKGQLDGLFLFMDDILKKTPVP